MDWVYFSCFVFICYLLGSISFAWMAGRLNNVDLREHGSGNLGATNAGRVLGNHWFFIIFFADVSKGLIPVLVAKFYAEQVMSDGLAIQLLPSIAAIGSILGHSFTIFHGFKGGKAVATSLGAVCGLTWLVAFIAFLTWLTSWLIIAPTFKINRSDAVGPSSVLSVVGILSAHFSFSENPFHLPDLPITIMLCMIAVLFIVRHRSNITKFLSQVKDNKNTATDPENADSNSE